MRIRGRQIGTIKVISILLKPYNKYFAHHNDILLQTNGKSGLLHSSNITYKLRNCSDQHLLSYNRRTGEVIPFINKILCKETISIKQMPLSRKKVSQMYINGLLSRLKIESSLVNEYLKNK